MAYISLFDVLQTAPQRICRIMPKVDSILNAQDIFLWPDGYWCFRQEFYQQLREGYSYRLLQVDSEEWYALLGGYPLAAFSRPQPHHRAAPGGSHTKS